MGGENRGHSLPDKRLAGIFVKHQDRGLKEPGENFLKCGRKVLDCHCPESGHRYRRNESVGGKDRGICAQWADGP